MAKDSYWFKHDSTAGRGLKMRKMQHLYGHEGKGVYWDVVEILRDQDGYMFDIDESSLQLLSDLIGYKDHIRFINWFKDSLRFGLFEKTDNYFFCPPLSKNMQKWEIKKANGSKGGRPKKTETITESIPNDKANQNHKRREDKIRVYLKQTQRQEASIKYLRQEKIIITSQDLFSLIDKFLTKVSGADDLERPLKEYAGWFLNWCAKQPLRQEDEISKANALR